jgi:uncharacterized YccA/Bax inhibitor family protein
MEMMSGNPLFNRLDEVQGASESTMTMAGVKVKTAAALLMVLVTASYSFANYHSLAGGTLMALAFGALAVGLVVGFKPTTAPYLTMVYAALEGVVLGAVSGMSNTVYPGIVINSIVGTFAVFMGMLILYRSGIIKVNAKFRAIVCASLLGICAIYLISFVLALFGIHQTITDGSGLISIVFSVGVCVVAAMTLAVDFDNIADGVASRAPKYMEWYSAFGLMVTIIWLYLEILHLLQKLKDRD